MPNKIFRYWSKFASSSGKIRCKAKMQLVVYNLLLLTGFDLFSQEFLTGLQIIFFTWKDIYPTKTPSWSDKTKLWSDITKNTRLNFISLKLLSYHFPRDLFALLLLITINSKIYHFTSSYARQFDKKYQPRKKKQSVCIPVVFTWYYCRGRKTWAILLYWSLKISF